MSTLEHICADCRHLEVERDARGWPKPKAVGHCRLRDFPVEGVEEVWCANHPGRNHLGFEARIGPIWNGNLPVVLGGMPAEEEGAGGACAGCGKTVPGLRVIVWRKDDKRKVFCSRECYFSWGGESDPSVPGRREPESEDLTEVGRLHKGLCEAEAAFQTGDEKGLHALKPLIRFTGPSLYRMLRTRKMLPKAPLRHRWPDIFRGAPKVTRERINPWFLEVQLALSELLSDPPEGLPPDASERAFEHARLRWGRLVIGDLLETREGPETPKDVDRRFRGRHRPQWREGESHVPENARRIFYVERNPDLAEDLQTYFGATSSTD